MLIEFTVENMFSYDFPATFSMVPGKITKKHVNHASTNGLKVLRGAIIFGGNASGKSNLLKVMGLFHQAFMRNDCRLLAGNQFRLKMDMKKDMRVEIRYAYDGKEFRYGATFDNTRVLREELHVVNKNQEDSLFLRENGVITEGRLFESVDWYRQRTCPVHSFYLSKLAQDGIFDFERTTFAEWDVVTAAVKGLVNFTLVHSKSKLIGNRYYKLLLENDFRNFLVGLLQNADIGITDVGLRPVGENEAEMLFNIFARMLPLDTGKDGSIVVFDGTAYYLLSYEKGIRKASEISLLHGVQKRAFRAVDESEGTTQLVQLAPLLYDLVRSSGVWVVDEFDCHLHPMLSKYLLKWFMDYPEVKSQLIVTAHDTNLMTHDIWRTDEVWFAEKRLDGSTNLYSLYQFTPRFDKRLDKGYLAGMYGALPCPGGEMVYG